MRVELSSLPAIHLGGECVMPKRTTWDVIASDEERATLYRAAEAIAERGEAFPLDAEALRMLARAVEVTLMVMRRKEEERVTATGSNPVDLGPGSGVA
jgi:hypothetical protein